MYDKTDKRRLYWLIKQYLSDKIDETTFCNDFHDTLVNEIYYEGLSKIENEVFCDLLNVVQHFSEYEEDFKLWSGFVTAKQLREKALETKEKLKQQSPI
jgi:hypothetical protein